MRPPKKKGDPRIFKSKGDRKENPKEKEEKNDYLKA